MTHPSPMTQNDEILTHLERGGKLTPLDALKMFGCLRAASRINELRRMGFDIKKTMIEGENGKRYAEYFL